MPKIYSVLFVALFLRRWMSGIAVRSESHSRVNHPPAARTLAFFTLPFLWKFFQRSTIRSLAYPVSVSHRHPLMHACFSPAASTHRYLWGPQCSWHLGILSSTAGGGAYDRESTFGTSFARTARKTRRFLTLRVCRRAILPACLDRLRISIRLG